MTIVYHDILNEYEIKSIKESALHADKPVRAHNSVLLINLSILKDLFFHVYPADGAIQGEGVEAVRLSHAGERVAERDQVPSLARAVEEVGRPHWAQRGMDGRHVLLRGVLRAIPGALKQVSLLQS